MKKEESLSIRDNSSLENRLSFNQRITKLINKKLKERTKPVISNEVVEIKFTKGGYTNLSKLKKSIVVKPKQQLIKTSKVITIVTPKSLKKTDKVLKKDKELLDQAVVIKKIITKKVKEYRKKLSSLEDEYNSLNSLVTKIYTKEQVKEILGKLISLKIQTDDLKLKCLFISSLSDFDDIDILANNHLSDLSSSFSKKADTTDIKLLINSCKKDLDYTDKVLDLVDKTSYLDYELMKKDEIIKKRDEDFKQEKEDVSDVNKFQEEIVCQIEEEISKTNELIVKIENFNGKENILSIKELREIAEDYIDYILNTDLLVKIFRFLRSLISSDKKAKKLEDRETLIKRIYTDYEDELKTEINSMNRLSDNLKKSLEQLDWLKTVFYEKFYKYKDLIKEYDDIYNKLEDLEKKLLSNCKIVDVTKQKLNDEKSKVKLYRK